MSSETSQGVGILGVGMAFPEEVRLNSWWTESTVASWGAGHPKSDRSEAPVAPPPGPVPGKGAAIVGKHLMAGLADPFQGSRSRHILSRDAAPSTIGIAAARDALTRASVDPESIDLLLTHTSVPDFLNTNTACTVHDALGLPTACLSLSVEGACNSFLLQLELATAMISCGRAERALLVQWCGVTRLLPEQSHYAPWFGDGASAVVVGKVPSDRGLLSAVHRTDGRLQNTLVTGIPGGRWYDDGKPVLYPESLERAKAMFIATGDLAAESIGAALERAGLGPDAVAFYAAHQGTAWFRRATQEAAGLDHAASVDTFDWTANLGASNIPVVLATAQRRGLLSDGDVVVAHAGGSGITWSAAVLRWGS